MNWQQMRTRLPVVNGACGGDFVWWRNCNGRRHGIQGRIATGTNGTFEHEFQRHVRGMQVGVTTGANAECGDCTLRFIVGPAFI